MITSTDDLLAGQGSDVRVGIGRGTSRGLVEAGARAAGGDVEVYDDPEELASDLASGRIGAAVRGDMPSDVLLPLIKRNLGVVRLERTVIMEPDGMGLFMLAPVGIDEGWSDERRFDIARRSADLAAKVGMNPRIAVMSGGRCEDRGRCAQVDRSIDSALNVVSMLADAGYDAYHCQILVEDAVREAGVIIAPEGVTGNIMFRTLHFIGGARTLGAPAVNTDRVYVDTSRAKTDYRDAIALARRLAEDSQ